MCILLIARQVSAAVRETPSGRADKLMDTQLDSEL
jgi:hypothetical protein